MAQLVMTAEQLTANGANTALVEVDPNDGYFDNVVGFISGVLKGEAINGKELLYGGITTMAALFIGGGYFGRSRALSGKEPIAGFIL